MTSSGPTLADRLRDARAALHRATTTQRLAAVLRERVLLGDLPPDTQLPEQQLAQLLDVSRNTLREAFQVLIAERLLVHLPHRGVFVRRLDADDVADIYRTRRVIECGALERPGAPDAVAGMRDAVSAGRRAARQRDWSAVGTADVRFHAAVTALAGSERLDAMVRGLFAELRLAFQLVPDPRALHSPYLARNAEILALVEAGHRRRAGQAMARYLDDAEAQVSAVLVAA
jgi:DNA-binding GntR family transcriptional regulator